MDAASLIPLPDTIPVPWGWFQFLLILTFMLHLLFMNVMLGTAIIALVGQLRRPGTPPPSDKTIASQLPYLIAFAVNLGVAPLLFMQVLYGHFMYTSSILMGRYWLAVVGLLIIAYYAAYIHKLKYEKLGNHRVKVLGLATALLLAIGFIFSNNMTLMLRPDTWARYFDQPNGTLLNLTDPTLIPRWLHFMTASVAIGGLYLAITGRKQRTEQETARVNSGLRWFSLATVVQIGIGVWFLFRLPPATRQLFLGESTTHTGLLITGVAIASLALLFGLLKKIGPTVAMTLATVLIMVLMRDLVRRAYLAPYFSPADLKVVPQYSSMVVFFISLIIGLAIIAYMIRLAINASRESGETRR